MKLINKEIGLSIIIDDNLIQQFYATGLAHYPNEYGGLLIGRYSNENRILNIENTLLPLKYKSSKYNFERGIEGLREKLEEYYSQDPSLFYVGEWHTHPDNPAQPSSTDLKALEEIIEHKEVFIDNPVLLILSIDKNGYEPIFYIQFKNEVYKYEEEKPD